MDHVFVLLLAVVPLHQPCGVVGHAHALDLLAAPVGKEGLLAQIDHDACGLIAQHALARGGFVCNQPAKILNIERNALFAVIRPEAVVSHGFVEIIEVADLYRCVADDHATGTLEREEHIVQHRADHARMRNDAVHVVRRIVVFMQHPVGFDENRHARAYDLTQRVPLRLTIVRGIVSQRVKTSTNQAINVVFACGSFRIGAFGIGFGRRPA